MLFDFRPKMIWAPVKIIHETDRAFLIDNGRRFWIGKSQISKIRMRNNFVEIYVQESLVG